jgi:hypothetical protein
MARWLTAVSAAGMALALAVLAAGHLTRAADVVSPSEFNEGPIAATLARWRTEPLSADWLNGPRLTPWSYGPGYYAVVRAIADLWPADDPLRPGRFVSALAALATAALLAGVVARSTRSGLFGAAAAAFYLAAPIGRLFADRLRVDSLAVLCSVASCVAATAGPRGLAASAVCVVLGSFVKQTVALAAAPVVIWLVATGRWRSAGLYAVAVAVAGAVGWATLDAVAGGLFGRTAVGGQLNHMDYAAGLTLAGHFLASPFGPAAAAALAVLALTRGLGALRELPAVAFVVNFGLMTLLAGKDGASAAYFLEASALAAWLIAGVGLPAVSNCGRRHALTAGVCLLVAVPAARDVKRFVCEQRWGPAPVAALLRERLSPGEAGFILADSHSLDDVVAVGRAPLVDDPYLVRLLVDNDGVSADGIVRALGDGSVPCVVFSQSLETHRTKAHPEFPAAVLAAVGRNYALEFQAERLYLYRFRAGP